MRPKEALIREEKNKIKMMEEET